MKQYAMWIFVKTKGFEAKMAKNRPFTDFWASREPPWAKIIFHHATNQHIAKSFGH
jgi:hypothetical protein